MIANFSLKQLTSTSNNGLPSAVAENVRTTCLFDAGNNPAHGDSVGTEKLLEVFKILIQNKTTLHEDLNLLAQNYGVPASDLKTFASLNPEQKIMITQNPLREHIVAGRIPIQAAYIISEQHVVILNSIFSSMKSDIRNSNSVEYNNSLNALITILPIIPSEDLEIFKYIIHYIVQGQLHTQTALKPNSKYIQEGRLNIVSALQDKIQFKDIFRPFNNHGLDLHSVRECIDSGVLPLEQLLYELNVNHAYRIGTIPAITHLFIKRALTLEEVFSLTQEDRTKLSKGAIRQGLIDKTLTLKQVKEFSDADVNIIVEKYTSSTGEQDWPDYPLFKDVELEVPNT